VPDKSFDILVQVGDICAERQERNYFFGPRIFTAPAHGSFWHMRDEVLVASKVRYGVEPIRGTPPWRASGIGASRPLSRVAATVCFLITERALSLSGRNWSSCP